MNPSKLTLLVATSTLAIGSIYAIKPTAKRAINKVYAPAPYSVTLINGGTYPHLTTGITTNKIYFKTALGPAVNLFTASTPGSKTIYYK